MSEALLNDPRWHEMAAALDTLARLPYNTYSQRLTEDQITLRQEQIDRIVKIRAALLRTHSQRDVRIQVREHRMKTVSSLIDRMMQDPPYNDLNVDAVLEVAFRRQDIERIYGRLPIKVLREILAMKRDQFEERLDTGQAGLGVAHYLSNECNDIELLIASRKAVATRFDYSPSHHCACLEELKAP